MSKSTYGVRRAGLASIATMTLVSAAAVAGAGSASAVADFKFQRIGGADRYETSTLVADQFATTNPTVILANGEPGNYADALSANTLAGEKNIPVLLTRKDKTPASVLAQLQEDGTKNITVVGGESVVSAAQVAALTAAGYTVTRVAGDDRFGTNADIIAASGAAAAGTGLIATGFNFPDALAAGPISFQGHPLGLSTANDVDQEVIDALKAAGVTKVLIFGGESAVGPGVVAKLATNGITVASRFAGTDRSDTSVQAAEYAVKNLGFTNTHVGVASGYVEGFGADALAGGPLEGKEKSPMLVTRDVNNPDNALDYLKAHANTLKDGHLYGGPAAISTAAQAAMEKAAQSTTTNQSFAATPSGNQTVQQGTVSQFTFSGITTSTVDIMLTGCENVTTDGSGTSTFPNSSNPGGTGNVANESGVDTDNDITVINGTANNQGQYANDVPVSNGSVSFTVSNADVDCYVAVVFDDADDDNNLDLGTNNQPSEAFGNSGDVNVITPEATDNSAISGTVASLDKAADRFSTDTFTYFYDSNDEFLLDGTPDTTLTMAQFEERLSAGDGVSGTYRSEPGNQSRFILDDTAPAAPTTVATQNPSGTNAGKPGIEVTWVESATPSVASYDVFRATATPPVITGQLTTCPAQTSGAFSKLGSVADGDGDADGDAFKYYDATASAPAAGQTQPQYCYYVVAIDQSGDSSARSNTAGPATATSGDTSGAPEFTSASAAAAGTTVVVNYDEIIKGTSTDADASNYQVTVKRGDVTTALTEVSTADTDTDTVTITVSGIPGGTFLAGDIIVVTAVVGGDGNTVLDSTDVAQPTNDAVQTTVS